MDDYCKSPLKSKSSPFTGLLQGLGLIGDKKKGVV